MSVDERMKQRIAQRLRDAGVPEHEIPERMETAELVASEFEQERPTASIQRVDSGGRTWFEVVDRTGAPRVADRIESKDGTPGELRKAHALALAASKKYGGARPWGDI